MSDESGSLYRDPMKLLLAALLLFTATAVGHAAPTREEALSAIAVLEKDILSVAAIEAAGTITQFSEESESVKRPFSAS